MQTYTGGEVARWIGAEDSDNPAPTVAVTEAAAGEHGATASPTAAPVTEAARTSATTSDDGPSNGLAIVALIVGALGLLAGVASLLATRRGRTAS